MSFAKDPDAKKFYEVDWSAWLLEGETITGSEWIVPDGISKGATPVTDTVATVWLWGGSVAETYRVTNRITTSLGRIDDCTIEIFIEER